MKNKLKLLFLSFLIIIISLFLGNLHYDVNNKEFLNFFLNKYVDILAQNSNNGDKLSFFMKRKKRLLIKSQLNEKLKSLEETPILFYTNNNINISNFFHRVITLSIKETEDEERIKKELLKVKIIKDVYEKKVSFKNRTGIYSGIKNGLIIGFSYVPLVIDECKYSRNNGEIIFLSIGKGYFLGIFSYFNMSYVCLHNGPIAYKIFYFLFWLIGGFFNVYLMISPYLLLKKRNTNRRKRNFINIKAEKNNFFK